MSEQTTENGARPRAPLGADLLIPILACGLALYYFISTWELVWEARATGTIVGLVLFALCAAFLVKLGIELAAGRGDLSFRALFTRDEFDRQRFGLLALVAIYVVTIYWVGATVGLFFLLIASMRLLGVTRWRTLVTVALVSSVFVHVMLITLLDGRLPKGWLIETLTSAVSGG